MVSKLVPALALILLAGPVMAVAADAPAGSSAPSSDAKSTMKAKKHHSKKKSSSSAPAAK